MVRLKISNKRYKEFRNTKHVNELKIKKEIKEQKKKRIS